MRSEEWGAGGIYPAPTLHRVGVQFIAPASAKAQATPTDPRLDKLHETLNDPRFQYQSAGRQRDFIDSLSDFARAAFDWYGRLDPVARALGTATLLALIAAGVTWLVTRDGEMSPRTRRTWIASASGAVFILAIIFFIIWGKDGPSINVLGLGPLGLLLLAILLVSIGGAAFILTARTVSPTPASVIASAEERNLSSVQSSQRAIEQAEAGNYRDAIRYLYLTTLILLDERGLLRFDHSLTNREYLQRLGSTPLGQLLTPIVDTFDRTWYGHTLPTREEYERYAALVNEVRNTPAATRHSAVPVPVPVPRQP